MVIENTYPDLSNIVPTDFELDRVVQTVAAADPGITAPINTINGHTHRFEPSRTFQNQMCHAQARLVKFD